MAMIFFSFHSLSPSLFTTLTKKVKYYGSTSILDMYYGSTLGYHVLPSKKITVP